MEQIRKRNYVFVLDFEIGFVYKIMKDTLTKLPCFIKYNSYTSSTNVPVKVRSIVEVK